MRCVERPARRRYEDSDSGVRSAREPDCVVWRIWWRVEEESGAVSISLESEVEKSEAVGIRRVDWRRWRVEGKWPVWKEHFWRRRVPERDFGSGDGG